MSAQRSRYEPTRRLWVVALEALERLAACEGERRVGQDGDVLPRSRGGERREGSSEQVVAGGLGRSRTVSRPCRSPAATQVRSVDDVVVDEGRHVDELDGDAFRHRWGRVWSGAEKRERRAKALAAGRERVLADRRHDTGVRPDDGAESCLDGVEVLAEPGGCLHAGDRAHVSSADPESAGADSGSRQSLKRPLTRPVAAMVV